MGTYLNPGNDAFAQILRGKYIDKSGLIDLINENIETPDKLICVSRPRRFGKSFAAKMLCAYYDKKCDSSHLFQGLRIEKSPLYREYMNRFDVIYIDMTNILQKAGSSGLFSFIEDAVTREILEAYPEISVGNTFDETLIRAVELTGTRFVMIIDEWDAPIRETPEIQDKYLEFLRMLFKSSGTTDKIFAAAYMTGILPIKKDGTESAISDFWEFTMLEPGRYQEYIGFTEHEVQTLCREYDLDFDEAKKWYDGYSFDHVKSIYNPYSIMRAVKMQKLKSYWRMSSAADALEDYIRGDYDGLFDIVMELLSGLSVPVDTEGFNNDVSSVKNRDDLLTLLIHLGYLAFDSGTQSVRIPNEEIRIEFSKAIREVKSTQAIERLKESQQLIRDTVEMNSDAVAAQIEKVHALISDPVHYNSEQALRCAIHIAYYAYPEHYLKFEELPAGDGYADIVYLPKRNSGLPALVVELKWNKTAEGAIDQIKRRRYYEALQGYGSKVLLVGINYDKEAGAGRRHHHCVIEEYRMEQ